VCGNRFQSSLEFPEAGFYAFNTGRGPREVRLHAVQPSAELTYYVSRLDFEFALRKQALEACHDPEEDKKALIGYWARTGASAPGLQVLAFLPRDSLHRFNEDSLGARSQVSGTFVVVLD
jgi:hypothetical protein